MTTSPDGTRALLTLLDVDATAWTLPGLTFDHGFSPIPDEPGEEHHGGEREGPQALVVSPDSRSALFAVEDRLIRYDLASGQVEGELEGPDGKGMVNDVVWSPDGGSLMIASAADGRARVLDAASGRVLRTLAVDGRVAKMAFAVDGRTAAVGTEVGTLAIVDLRSASSKPRLLTPSTQEITGLGFLGGTLVVAARDGKIRLFDLATGRETKAVASGAPIARFALSATDGLVAVANSDNVIRIFTAPALALRAHYAWHQASITALAWGVGPTLLAADNDGEFAAWTIAP